MSIDSVNVQGRTLVDGSKTSGHKVLFGFGAIDDLNDTRTKLLDGGNVVSQNTEVSCSGRNVHLSAKKVSQFQSQFQTLESCLLSHVRIKVLVEGSTGKGQRHTDLVAGGSGLSVSSAECPDSGLSNGSGRQSSQHCVDLSTMPLS